MKIESYSFGEIVIDGKRYTSDLKIIQGSIVCNWWRKDGHSLCENDIKDALSAGVNKFIIGCGYSSALKVPEALKKTLADRGIILISLPTKKAVEEFNNTTDLIKTAFGFHLTC